MSPSISVEQAAMSVKSVAAHALRKRLDAVWDEVPVAARSTHDEPQRIHRLRVATRRALAAIEVFHSVIPRKRARWFVRRLHELRALERLAILMSWRIGFMRLYPYPRSRQPHSVVSPLKQEHEHDSLQCLHASGMKPVDRSQSFMSNFSMPTGLVAWNGCLKNSATSRIQTVKNLLAIMEGGTLSQWLNLFAITDRRLHGINQLHAFRIKVKQLRYTMELFLSVFQPLERVRCCDALEKVQETLGTFTDNAAAADRLRRLENCSATDWDRSLLENLLRETSQQADDARREFVTWWSASRRRSLKRKLTRVLRTQSA